MQLSLVQSDVLGAVKAVPHAQATDQEPVTQHIAVRCRYDRQQ